MSEDKDLKVKIINSITIGKCLAETLGSFCDKEINKTCIKITNP